MRKTIIMGVILSCFLLLVTPCINAVEYKEVNESFKYSLTNSFKGLLLSFISNSIINNAANLLLTILLLYEIFLFIIFFVMCSTPLIHQMPPTFLETLTAAIFYWIMFNLNSLFPNIFPF